MASVAQAAALWEQLSAFGPDDFHTAVAAPTASATRAGVLKAEAEAEVYKPLPCGRDVTDGRDKPMLGFSA